MFHFFGNFFQKDQKNGSDLFPQLLRIADEMPYSGLREHVEVQLSWYLTDVSHGAVLVKDVDGGLARMIGVVGGDTL